MRAEPFFFRFAELLARDVDLYPAYGQRLPHYL